MLSRIKFLGLAVLLAGSVALMAQTATPALSEAQQLKVENHLLHVQIVQLQSQLAQAQERVNSCVLIDERAKLVEEFRKTLKAPADAQFDWETKTFKPATGPTQ
jgi:predicted amidohydrolase